MAHYMSVPLQAWLGVFAGPAPLPRELTTKYKIGKVIGEGNFATVKECVDK